MRLVIPIRGHARCQCRPCCFIVFDVRWAPRIESAFTSKGRIFRTSAKRKLAYVMSGIPAENGRLLIRISKFEAVASSLRTVSTSIAGARRGSSLLSTVASESTRGLVSGQSMPIASADTVRACFAADGAVLPRPLRGSRKSRSRTTAPSPVSVAALSLRVSR